MESFIDLCILMGCDYCPTIKGVGPKRALDYIRKYGSIEKIVENEKLEVPENFGYMQAREIFRELPNVQSEEEHEAFNISYDTIDRKAIVDFLCNEKGFNEARVASGVDKIMRSRTRGVQTRLDGYFTKGK